MAVAQPVMMQQPMMQQPGVMPMGMPPDPAGFNTMQPLEFMLGASTFIAIKQEMEMFEAMLGCAFIPLRVCAPAAPLLRGLCRGRGARCVPLRYP